MATILVIDDERLLCDLLQEMLQRHGHEVFTAYSGGEGVARHKERRPHFTILDLHLPDMNGIEVLKRIRENDPTATVLILTGAASDKLEREAQELGVTEFLIKGLSPEVLMGAVTRTVQAQSPSETGPPTQDNRKGASILVVDDEQEVCELLTEFLTSRGFRVQSALDGPTALALALVESEPPHLIVLDIMMPGMNGIEVLRRLRAKKYAGGVMMLTASTDSALLKKSLDLEAVDILGKPIDLERLALAIQVGLILNRRSRERGSVHHVRHSPAS
jgi:DNA-binding response OmpR family regulator